MSQTTILDNDYATLWYHPESQIVHHQFHKYIHGETFRDVLQHGLETLQQHGAHKWLSDDRRNSALPQSDIDWAADGWIREMIDSGWKYWAMVMPYSAVGKANMQRVVESYEGHGLTIEIFEDPDEALQWLHSI